MKVTFEEYHAVAAWKWTLPDGADDTCGICRVEFEGTCAKCKYPGEECPVSVGECSHCFHLHCIQNWINSEASQGRCPMCRQDYRERVAAPAAPHTPSAAAVATTASGTPRTPQDRRTPIRTPGAMDRSRGAV